MIEHLCSTDLPSMPSWRSSVCAGTQEAISTYTFNCLQWHWLRWVVVINSLIQQASCWLDFLETSWSNIAEVVIGIVMCICWALGIADMVESYISAGATAVVLSDSIFMKSAMDKHDYHQIRQQATIAASKCAVAATKVTLAEKQGS